MYSNCLVRQALLTSDPRPANAKSGRLEKFSMTATQAILYFDSIAPHYSFEIHFRLQAKYPIRAHGFTSRVYEYYDPNVSATTQPALCSERKMTEVGVMSGGLFDGCS